MEVTPTRKSPRFASTPHSPSRSTFDLNAYAPSLLKRASGSVSKKSKEEDVNVSSSRRSDKISSESKGKFKMAEVDLPHDSDFEDEIPLSKRAKLNKAQSPDVKRNLHGTKESHIPASKKLNK